MNKHVYQSLVALLLLWMSPNLLCGQNLFINEFMASNDVTIADENGEFDDWVEIYNGGTTPIDIGGYYLSDDLTDIASWQVPTTNPSLTTIAPDSYLILWFDGEPEQGVLHIDEKLGGSGEDIVLTAPNGTTIIDSYTYGAQLADVSEGRSPDGFGDFTFYTNPTPGTTNGTPNNGQAATPIASQIGGLYSGTLSVTLSTTTPNASIRYTTDGTLPDENSTLYNTALTLTTTTNLRAITIAPTFSNSPVMTHSYLFDVSHTFGIVSFTSDPDDFFGEENGLFPNFERDVELPIYVEMFEPNGTNAFSQLMEVEIQGTGSAVLPQKSLAMKAKGSLGSSTIDYPVFPDLGFTQYRSLAVRNSGQDWNITMFRDAMVSSLVRDIEDLAGTIKMPKLYLQAYRPGVVYINGAYWGIQNIRERMDKRYLKVHFDLDEDEIDFLDEENEVKEGDLVAWNSLQQFLQNNSLSSTANFNTVDDLVDLDAYLDYIVFNVFIDNADWPSNNNRRWRERSPNGKWRWMVKDLDFSFGLFQAGGGFNTGDFTPNSLARLLVPSSNSWPNVIWSTLLFRRLTENDQWRANFINRMADQLNVFYNTPRILNRIDEFRTTYLPERQKHADRWSSGFVNWEPNIQKLRDFANGRPNAVYGHFVSEFNDINGTADVTIEVSPSNGGQINFSTLTLSQPTLPFTGKYFAGVDIPVEAIPAPGFEFVGWSVSSMGNNASTSINLSGNETITAIFQPSNGMLNQTINFAALADKLTTDAPFSVSATATSNLPVSFSIVSGPATISGNTITLTGQTGTVTVAANQAGNTQYNPAPEVTRSFSVIQDNPTGMYCDARGNQPWVEYISNVTFRTIDNDSGKNQYGDFTNQITNASQGGSYPISIQPTFSWTQYDEYFRVWIDYNQDGDFNDNGEVAFSKIVPAGASGSTPSPATGTIQIPNNATVGATRMRVSMRRGAYAEPCGNFDSGEVEDYRVFIEEAMGGSITVNCPNNISVSAPIGTTGRIVTWNEPTASTTCELGATVDIQQVSGDPSGSFFSVGSTEINYLITDDCGNTSMCSFTVTVTGGDPSTLTLSCPNDITVTAPQGTSNATVSWANPAANSDCPTGTPTVQQTQGDPSGSNFPIGTTTIAYEATDECNNVETCSFTITVNAPNNGGPMPSGYCAGSSAAPWFLWIGNVQFGDINNTSAKRQTNDFTSQSTTVNQGGSYTISIQPIFSWTQYDTYVKVWIDYNRDGDFDDAGEEVLSDSQAAGTNGTTANPITGNIAIPNGTSLGTTRMRISMRRDAFPTACDQVDMGEVEDYAIVLQGGNAITVEGRSDDNVFGNTFIATQTIQIYPNPTKEFLFLVAADFAGQQGAITIHDAQGRLVVQQKIGEIQGHPLRLALPQLTTGTYWFSLVTNGKVAKRELLLLQ